MESYVTLIVLGSLFFVGMLTDEIGRRTRLPRVTLLILFGVLAGPIGIDIVPSQANSWYELLATTALTMVAFLLGGSLSFEQLRHHGRSILSISIAVVLTTIIVVAGGLIAIGIDVALALLFAGIATATAPAATLDVIRQVGAEGEFTDTLRGIVAVDDAWGLIAFSFILIAVNVIAGNGIAADFWQGIWEVGGALVLGVLIGFPAAYLTGRLRQGEPIQAEALAIVFLSAGFALWLEVSFLLTGIVSGMVVVNFAKHHARPFHEIENIEWPFMILFFFLAGLSLQVDRWQEFALIIAGLLVLRTFSRIAGGWMGAKLGAAPKVYRRWIGLALLPQAGVAVGMALVASHRFPELRDVVLPVTIGATVVFEVVGPLATMIALAKAGETKR